MAIFQCHNTALAEWHSLIHEAELRAECLVDEALESYLVYLLMRFSKNSDLVHSILALDFLNSLDLIGRQKHLKLQELGDKCLLLAGLFPERAIRKQVSARYFINMGQLAFDNLYQNELHTLHPNLVYRDLTAQFAHLVQILKATRNQVEIQQELFLIDQSHFGKNLH